MFLSIIMSSKAYSFDNMKLSFVEGGDFYVGSVFGAQNYESH
ncbi:spore coat protein CotH, partial [Photorhabdus sp. S12-55]